MENLSMARRLLKKNQIEAVFTFLNGLWQEKYPMYRDQLILVSARYYSWKHKQIIGTTSSEEDINSIRDGLLSLMNDWEEEETATAPVSTKLSYSEQKRFIHLKKRISDVSGLISEWEEKRETAENPSEIRRSEREIVHLKENQTRYESEFEKINEKQKLAEPAINTGSHDKPYDAFLSFANQDKYSIAVPLVEALEIREKRIWCSAVELTLGDSIAEEVNKAISLSRYGIIILSPNYFKAWPINELNALFAKYTHQNSKVILPIWHEIQYEEVLNQVPLIADKLAISSNEGIDVVAEALVRAMKS